MLSLLAVPAAAAAGTQTTRARHRGPAPSAKLKRTLLPVWALLDGRTPVSGARVWVYAGIPPKVSSTALTPTNGHGKRTNGAGVVTLEFARLPRSFTVVIRGGRVLHRPLHGSMSAQVSGYRRSSPVRGVAAGPVVHINPVTTLIAAWRRVDPRVNAAHAQRVIDRALGIPGWADAIDLSVNDQWLSGRIFLRDVPHTAPSTVPPARWWWRSAGASTW